MKSALNTLIFSILFVSFHSFALAIECAPDPFEDCLTLDETDETMEGYTIGLEILYGYCRINCADVKTFRVIQTKDEVSGIIAKDKNYFFFRGTPLEGISTTDYKIKQTGKPDYFLIYDADTVYLNTIYFPLIDSETFDFLDTSSETNVSWFKDKDHVYSLKHMYDGLPETLEILEGADPDYFYFGYYNSGDAVYWYGKKVEGADAGSFERMKCDYSGETAKDKDNVFWKGEIAYEIDAKSFASLASNCFDKNGIYDDNDNLKRDRTLDSLKEDYKDNNQDSGMVNDSIKSALLEYKEQYPGYTPQPAIDPENPPKHPTLDKIRDIITDYKYLNPPVYYAILIGPFVILFAVIGFVIWKKKRK